jgi:hypothetical protein
MLCSTWWSDRLYESLDYYFGIMKRLLHYGTLKASENVYPKIDCHSPEAQKRARIMMRIMRKRSMDSALLDMAELFPYEHDLKQRLSNNPFFPEISAFIRCDGLKPELLVEMLKQEDCEKAIVFPGYALTDTHDAYYVFESAVPKEDFLKILEKEESSMWDKIGEEVRACEIRPEKKHENQDKS